MELGGGSVFAESQLALGDGLQHLSPGDRIQGVQLGHDALLRLVDVLAAPLQEDAGSGADETQVDDPVRQSAPPPQERYHAADSAAAEYLSFTRFSPAERAT